MSVSLFYSWTFILILFSFSKKALKDMEKNQEMGPGPIIIFEFEVKWLLIVSKLTSLIHQIYNSVNKDKYFQIMQL